MAFIDLTDNPAVTEPDRVTMGYVPNYAKLFAHRPEVYAAWKQLSAAVCASMDLRRYELATFAAARRLQSSYCALAHGKVLLDKFVDAAQLQAIAVDHHNAGLDEIDAAVMDLADKVAANAGAVTQADVDRLTALGLTDDEVLDVVLTAAARCFFAKTLDATGLEPDAAYQDLDPAVRDLLATGRPIEQPESPQP